MGEGKRPELSIEQQIAKLVTELADAKRQIQWMQTLGGFTDAKSHSIRATRLEERLERVEMKVGRRVGDRPLDHGELLVVVVAKLDELGAGRHVGLVVVAEVPLLRVHYAVTA